MIYQRKIKLEETDATGVIFFAKLQSIGLECIEIFLNNNSFSVPEMMEKGMLFPIVHAEANYYLPLRVKDELNIFLFCEKVGTKSVQFYLEFYLDSKLAADMRLVQVLMDSSKMQSIPLTKGIQNLFETLPKISKTEEKV